MNFEEYFSDCDFCDSKCAAAEFCRYTQFNKNHYHNTNAKLQVGELYICCRFGSIYDNDVFKIIKEHKDFKKNKKICDNCIKNYEKNLKHYDCYDEIEEVLGENGESIRGITKDDFSLSKKQLREHLKKERETKQIDTSNYFRYLREDSE